MKTNHLYLGALLICLSACKKEEKTEITTDVKKDTIVAETPPPVKMDSAAMMKAWAEYSTPGENHKMLASENGKWDESMIMKMDPDAPEEKMTMSCVNKMILGGRYQQSIHTGTYMGKPFEGISTVGYNNASGEYNQTWTDNMATGIMYMTGKYDEATKTINFTGDCVDPMTKKPKKIRQTYQIVDNDTRKMESFDIGPDGKEYKSMEITMTRKK